MVSTLIFESFTSKVSGLNNLISDILYNSKEERVSIQHPLRFSIGKEGVESRGDVETFQLHTHKSLRSCSLGPRTTLCQGRNVESRVSSWEIGRESRLIEIVRRCGSSREPRTQTFTYPIEIRLLE